MSRVSSIEVGVPLADDAYFSHKQIAALLDKQVVASLVVNVTIIRQQVFPLA